MKDTHDNVITFRFVLGDCLRNTSSLTSFHNDHKSYNSTNSQCKPFAIQHDACTKFFFVLQSCYAYGL